MECICGYSIDNDEFIFCPMCGMDIQSLTNPDGTVIEKARAAMKRKRSSMLEAGLALKKIRDEKLYFLFDCDSMTEYVESREISRRHAYRLMKLAEQYLATTTSDIPRGEGS